MDVQLVMFKTNGKRHDFPLNQEITVLGRGHGCDLRIPLTSVSREHCQIELRDDGAYLSDLGSSNGTYHNSTRITEVELEAGDTVMVGPVHFTVVVDGKPEQIEPVKTILEEDESADQAGAQGKKKSVNILADSDVADAIDEDESESDDAAEESPSEEPKKTTPIARTEDSDDIASFLDKEEALEPAKNSKSKSKPEPEADEKQEDSDEM
ncbi:MAG: FHA domain-containing protein, partial [Phycisphaeraceae bacterium]|nr:FHA domain-containing protein [Phycisphaeraceae bacterium]